jgi:hypothetical protein
MFDTAKGKKCKCIKGNGFNEIHRYANAIRNSMVGQQFKDFVNAVDPSYHIGHGMKKMVITKNHHIGGGVASKRPIMIPVNYEPKKKPEMMAMKSNKTEGKGMFFQGIPLDKQNGTGSSAKKKLSLNLSTSKAVKHGLKGSGLQFY